MKRVWITGGRGFAGRHLRAELESRGVRCRILDRVDAPVGDEAASLRLDLAEWTEVAAALDAEPADAIVHLAAQSSGARSLQSPRETLRNNVESTLGLLEALRRRPPTKRPRMISVGSCEEYGAPEDGELPLREDHPLRPRNPYAVSKAAQTLLVQQYRRAHGLDLLAVRAFTHTGPGQSDRFVLGSWARQIAALEADGGGVLHVGNLAVSRDFSDVREVVRAYADLLEVEWPEDVVQICSGRETPLREALDHLLARARAPIRVEVDPARLRPADVPRFVGDPSRLREWLGWVPSWPLARTLDDLLEEARRRVANDAQH